MSTLAELTEESTPDEVRAAIYAAIAANGVSTTTWKPGAVVRTVVASVAIVLSAFSKVQSLIASMGFLEHSEGDWLTLVALFVYGVERDEGSFATGEIELDNTGGGVYSGDPGDLVVFNSTTGKAYRNTEAFAIAALETGVVVAIEAIELGTESTSAPDEIDDFVTPLLGVTVTNPAAVVGRDAESDTDLKVRCREKTGALSPDGPRDAYAYVARSAVREDGSSIGVTRILVDADGDGSLVVYLATGAGEVADPDDVDTIDELIQTQVVPLAVTATVVSATPLPVAVTYELWVRDTSALTDDAIEDAVALELTDYLAEAPIGGFVVSPATGKIYRSALETVIGATRLVDVIKVTVTVPAADVDVDATEATVAGTITCTAIHQISQGII
jgi:phage-related baseplate assembly protein